MFFLGFRGVVKQMGSAAGGTFGGCLAADAQFER
jgi:hypothetical protein